MKNTCPFYIVFRVLKVLLIKVCKLFIAADIIFHKVLELHSTLSEKDFHHEFSFF